MQTCIHASPKYYKNITKLIWDLTVYPSGWKSGEVKSILTFHGSGCVYIAL